VTSAVIASAIAAALLSGGCNSSRLIGAVCPGADGGTPIDASCGDDGGTDASTGTTLAVGLDRSGASLLDADLAVGGASLAPVLRLRGERATAAGWPSEAGAMPVLAPGGGMAALSLGAPFTDGTRAVGLGAGLAFAAAEPAVGAVGADDFALEIVLRAAAPVEIVDKQAGGVGWSLSSSSTGELSLFLRDATGGAAEILSAALPAGAWAHCVFWVSRAAGGRADCDGRAGALMALPANLGTLDSTGTLGLGGGATRVAFLALYRAAPGALGAAAGWQVASARRFAALTGARPEIARGSALPAPGLRDGPAYLDLQAAAGAPRRLFLVGPDWPRVACRTDVAGAFACGFLSEPRRTRAVPASAAGWTARELAIAAPAASTATLADDGPGFEALVPSVTAAVHALSVMRNETDASQTFSFFARARASGRVAAVAGARGATIFDVAAGAVVSAPAGVRASIEPWGDGVFRCAITFEGAQVVAELGLHLLDAAGVEVFAGDGATAAIEVAGLQLDVGLVSAASLQVGAIQPGDRLTFVGDDGNLPTGSAVTIGMRVLLPAGARITDQAVLNLNRDGTFDDQVQLFVRGDLGLMKFWGLRGADTYWTFDHPTPMTDGKVHEVRAGWDPTTARVELDGVPRVMQTLMPNGAPFLLNRIDVGFSALSSGALEGLVGGLTIGAAP
jgi:hypothetical protein